MANKVTIVVLVAITVFRLTLVDRGLMYWWDERMHWFSMSMWSDLAAGNWGDFWTTPFHPKIQGRPLWIILNMIPAGFQVGLFLISGIKTETPTSLHVVGVYNVFLSMIIVVLFWLIAKKLLADSASALVATIIYALLANSAVYVRQMSPIYSSLILYLSSFLLLVEMKTVIWKRVIVAGLMTGLGQLTYASYFLFPLFNLTVLIYRLIRSRQYRVGVWSTTIGGFCLGYVLPILLFEFWARSVGTSIYASIARNPGLNPTFTEALLFLPRYLIEGEGKIGLILIVLSLLLFLAVLKLKKINLATVLGISSWLIYILFAITTLFHHRIYARVVHIYILFLIIGIVSSLELLNKRGRYICFLILGIISVISFYGWASKFQKLTYPWEVRFNACKSFYECPSSILEVTENTLQPPGAIPAGTKMILVNTLYMAPIEERMIDFRPPKNFGLAASWPHPLNFIPYQLEGYSPQERQRLRQRAYTIRVYRQ